MTLPFVISLPHCSGRVPADIRPALALSEAEILTSVDIGADEIFGRLPARGVLRAEWSRLVVDLNRDSRQRDDRGLVPRLDYQGRTVYRKGMYPDGGAVERRIARYYLPFHRAMADMLERPEVVGLLDCHSMNGVGPAGAPDAGRRRKDVVLGNNGDVQGEEARDRGPLTCPRPVMAAAKAAFEQEGFSVSLNDPYAGGFIATTYGLRLAEAGKMAIQIEINQALYVGSRGKAILPGALEAVRARVSRALEHIAALVE